MSEHKKYSLFIGRYQPPHVGHLTLIKKVLDEGKNVCVAFREEDGTDKNPFSMNFRIESFTELLINAGYAEKILRKEIILTPFLDIGEVCHGRKVGWGIREIKLDEKIEAISATKIREETGLVK